MLGYLSLDIVCASMLIVFLELRSRKTVRFSEEIMSADKYPCIFLRQMESIVYLYRWVSTLCEVLSSFVNERQFVIDNIALVNVLD